jgi:hypothetical protein
MHMHIRHQIIKQTTTKIKKVIIMNYEPTRKKTHLKTIAILVQVFSSEISS